MVEACLTEHAQERLSEEMTFELTPEETEESNKTLGRTGNSLAVYWLRPSVSNVGNAGSVRGWGTEIPHAA